MRDGQPLYCSFCGKSQDEVRKLIAGPMALICDECVDLCHDIVDHERHTVPAWGSLAEAGYGEIIEPTRTHV